MKNDKEYLSITEFAEKWGTHKSNVYQRIYDLQDKKETKHKYFEFFKFGSVYVVKPTPEFERFLRSRKKGKRKNGKSTKNITASDLAVDNSFVSELGDE